MHQFKVFFCFVGSIGKTIPLVFGQNTTLTRIFMGKTDIFPGPHDIRWFSAHGFFLIADGFLFPVKELGRRARKGIWTNPGHWVRVLDAAGSYMYIVL
jgi:hypothetical protein